VPTLRSSRSSGGMLLPHTDHRIAANWRASSLRLAGDMLTIGDLIADSNRSSNVLGEVFGALAR